jgi:hypothetical protein
MRKSFEIARTFLEVHLRPHLEGHGLSMSMTDGKLEVFPSPFRALRRRRRRPGDAPEAVPVTPNQPRDLSGGAAADLSFGE